MAARYEFASRYPDDNTYYNIFPDHEDTRSVSYEMGGSSEQDYQVIAAIDFGSSHSGYAYAYMDEMARDRTKVHTPVWQSGAAGAVSQIARKVPTKILFKSDMSFDSFGFEAENRFADLFADSEIKDYFYFTNIKMQLYRNYEKLNRGYSIYDFHGRRMPVMTVISECIRFLKENLLIQVRKSRPHLDADDVKWVITVPAIWNDKAKQFMRESAEQAGIASHSLSLALEPEAASLYCKQMIGIRDKHAVSMFESGTTYVILDAGGGTIDLTVHAVQHDGSLKEVHQATGGPWGGVQVDKAFLGMLEDIVGRKVMNEFHKQHTDDFQDLIRDFENLKPSIADIRQTGKRRLRIPCTLEDIYQKVKHGKLEDAIKRSRFCNSGGTMQSSKLVLDNTVFAGLFEETVEGAISALDKVFKNARCENIDAIVLVGGFGESKLLQEEIRKVFPWKKVVIADEPTMAVVKGAVMFGYDPSVITQRIARRSYGICSYVDFKEGVDPPENRVVINGVVKCKNFFKKHVTVGEELVVGKAQHEEVYKPVTDRQTEMEFKVYTSPFEDPRYIEHAGCTYLGNMIVNLGGSGRRREVLGRMMFGETEVKMIVKEQATGMETVAKFECLG